MRPEKATIVEDLSARLNQSPFLIVTEYTGMNVLQPVPDAEWLKILFCVAPSQKWDIQI